MPKHPLSPPFKSSLALSRSKDIRKYMTTIPKPIIVCKWKSWNMKRLQDNRLIWYPSEYNEILNHLLVQWKDKSAQILENLRDEEKTFFYITYNPVMNITSTTSWEVIVKKLKLKYFTKWIYNPQKPEYLIFVMPKQVNEDITSLMGLERMKDIIEKALKILLANT